MICKQENINSFCGVLRYGTMRFGRELSTFRQEALPLQVRRNMKIKGHLSLHLSLNE
jgi:hypothetical protein